MISRKLGGWLCIISAIVPLGMAIYYYQQLQGFQARAVSASAVVVGYISETGNKPTRRKSDTQYPVVEFMDAEGQTTRGKTNVGTAGEAYPVGSSVRILYDPDARQDLRIDSFLGLYFKPLMFMLPGLLWFGFGVWRLRDPGGKA